MSFWIMVEPFSIVYFYLVSDLSIFLAIIEMLFVLSQPFSGVVQSQKFKRYQKPK